MRILEIDSDEDFNRAVFGEQDYRDSGFFRRQYESLKESASMFKKEWVDKATKAFNYHFGEEAVRRARRAIKQVESLFSRDIVKPLSILEDFQTANPSMRRWVRANPVIRQMWKDQRISGYDEECPERERKEGFDNYDYRRVMDGIAVDLPDGSSSYTNYYEDLRDGDRELIVEEQTAILTTWDILELYAKATLEDPTSLSGDRR